MRLAIIADIHEDIVSLQVALRKIEKFSCDEIICLGDISGYSIPYYKYIETRNAHECLSLIRSNCAIVVLGNHDIHAAQIIPEKSGIFDFPENWYRLDYQERLKLSANTLWLHEENDLNPLYTHDDLEYLRSLKQYSVYSFSDKNILFSHYLFPNISGIQKAFYSSIDEFREHANFMNSLGCVLGFNGHTHVRGYYTVTNGEFNQYRYKKQQLYHNLANEPQIIGIPPISSHQKRNGFCIFDLNEFFIEVVKL